jgi:hypothetical protein
VQKYHTSKESFRMNRKRFTRRELLHNSTALGGALFLASASLVPVGCRSKTNESLTTGKWRELRSPAPAGSISPRVTALPDGSGVVSWLEPEPDRKATLRFALWREGNWFPPSTVVSGLAFSRDQASAPGVIGLSPMNLLAYWSQRVSLDQQSANEIALYMAVSVDRGEHWSAPVLVNRSAAQPGEDNAYASAIRRDDQSAQFVWLDGRDWQKFKRVQLMSRVVSISEQISDSTLLDPDTCTCCSTSIVNTSSGFLVSYRGHNDQNIRDISLVGTAGNGWSRPNIANPDHWHIEACPVNGPHLDSANDSTALIWFTAPQDQPAVKIAFSNNGDSNFAPPLRVDTARAIGRTQVALLRDGSAIGFWLENDSGKTRFIARRVRKDGSMGEPLPLAYGTNFGYPHVARTSGGILAVWSERNPASAVRVGLLQLD